MRMLKKGLCLLLCLMMLGTTLSLAEENTENISDLSAEELAEIQALDDINEQEYEITGRVYEEKNREDFTVNSPALYRAVMSSDYSIFSERSIESKRIYKPKNDINVDILYVGLQWVITRYGEYIGYSRRQWIAKSTIEAYDPVNTPPLNCQKHAYIATTATECHVRKTMDPSTGAGDDGNNWVILKPGTMISIWQFYEGWAMVNYMRSYGYIDPNELTDLKPVSPTDEMLYADCPIAAYTSYYNMAQTEKNLGRIHNIKMGCSYISRELQPGELFDANSIMGPYNARKGYKKAGVLIDGTAVLGYGGGTCQVSSTLYNVLVQLPKINVLYRRPHGWDGAKYLPIHCDAAVGNSNLNLRFTNEYDFPIRIEARSNDDGALLIMIFRADA